MQYLIANTLIEIRCGFSNANMPLYKDFRCICRNKRADIIIKICETTVQKKYIQLIANEHTTHIWRNIEKKYVMLFSDRGIYLDESPIEKIWYLVGDKNGKEWILYVPNRKMYTEKEFIEELEMRLWLQRLFIYYCMNSNMAVVHGALGVINGEGCLFLGDSGSGKSTMCSILEKNIRYMQMIE